MARAGIEIPPIEIKGELEWELEAIINHNVVRSRKASKPSLVEFKVRWKGDYEDSWHELIDFENSMDTVEAYLSNNCTKQTRRAIYAAFSPLERSMLSASMRRDLE